MIKLNEKFAIPEKDLLKKISLLFLAVIILFAGLTSAEAATFTVTNTDDSGAGSLRQAIEDANNAPTDDEINFDAGVFGSEQTITLTSSELRIENNGSLTINGTGADQLRIIIANAKRIFEVETGADTTINDLTIGGRNKSNGLGGGIENSGFLELNRVTVEGARANEGGGILNNAALTINNSTIGNNTVNSEGGGIFNMPNAVLTIINSTVANNTANFEGGGISNRGTATADYLTLSGNAVTKKNNSNGGGVFNAGTFNSGNSIYAYNMSKGDGPDFFGTMNSQGYNLIEDTEDTIITGITLGNLVNIDPLLDKVLRNNGGTTQTLALLENSPAIDAADPLSVQSEDQRSFPRPTDGNGDFIARADIGAFEAPQVIPPIQNGEIAFQSNRAGRSDIWTINEDGTGLFQITTDPASDLDPSFSNEGSKIAFYREIVVGQNEIFIVNPDGTNEQQVTFGGFSNLTPTFSPDDSRIAFTSDRTGTIEIFTIKTDGTDLRQVTNDTIFDGLPDYSPTEEKIVYFKAVFGGEIYIINSDGTNEQRLTDSAGGNLHPSFSPDGSKIVFLSSRDGDSEIYIMNSDGTNQQRLTFEPGIDTTPSFSPDGTKIVFTSHRTGNAEVFTMNLDGSNVQQVTNNPAVDGNPSWGRRILN